MLLNGTGDKKIRFGYKNQYGHERWYEAPFEGVVANLQRRYEETQSEFLKAELERYMADKPCPACKGRRLKPESLAVTVAGQQHRRGLRALDQRGDRLLRHARAAPSASS